MIDRNAIPDSGSVKIGSHTYTWKRQHNPTYFTLTKDNFGDSEMNDLETEVSFPAYFTYANQEEWDIGMVGEIGRGGACCEHDSDWIDQFECLFDWFEKNFPATVTETA